MRNERKNAVPLGVQEEHLSDLFKSKSKFGSEGEARAALKQMGAELEREEGGGRTRYRC